MTGTEQTQIKSGAVEGIERMENNTSTNLMQGHRSNYTGVSSIQVRGGARIPHIKNGLSNNEKSNILDFNKQGNILSMTWYTLTQIRGTRPEWQAEELFLKVGTVPDPISTENAEFKNMLISSNTFQRVGIRISGTKLPLVVWESLRISRQDFYVCTPWRGQAMTGKS